MALAAVRTSSSMVVVVRIKVYLVAAMTLKSRTEVVIPGRPE
jgi:hypothetical protein